MKVNNMCTQETEVCILTKSTTYIYCLSVFSMHVEWHKQLRMNVGSSSKETNSRHKGAGYSCGS